MRDSTWNIRWPSALREIESASRESQTFRADRQSRRRRLVVRFRSQPLHRKESRSSPPPHSRPSTTVFGTQGRRPSTRMSCVPVANDGDEACANCVESAGATRSSSRTARPAASSSTAAWTVKRHIASVTRRHASSARQRSMTRNCTVRDTRDRRGTSARSARCRFLYRCMSIHHSTYAA